ncbi:uncharacterized protein LOC108735905 isoform X2 [Agrilus planipennis]|uniref:Uncharacterized protein LOC108735905 isoform X2 n=1 Tax=Agrilus planipennis TaxID=224129 RepID=A0A1W4WU29_AGRPL|nr:uncharacterized protein LOC108735905 isoform X2 [Agrilus planipennis]
MWVDLYVFMLISTINLEIAVAERNSTIGCSPDLSCLRCSPNGCIKCSGLIVFPSRKCVSSCPSGHRAKWSNMPEYLGRICVHSGYFLGLSGKIVTVVVGSFCGLVISVCVIAGAVAYLRYKRKRLRERLDTNSDLDDKPEERDFMKQLETLRPYSHTFLDMLNDARRQLRELRLEGDNLAVSAYKPVVRDLAKILLLLNRPLEKIAMPDDWEHLFNWAEKALKRYKRMSETSIGQVAQLIDFLQGPVITTVVGTEVENPRQTILSTFKPELSLGSSQTLSDNKTKTASTNGVNGSPLNTPLNPQWKFNYPLVTNNPLYASDFSSLQWKNSKEYLSSPYLLEDDFFQLGFRPQDEITTEL